MLAGNLAAIGVGGIVASVSSYLASLFPFTRDLISGVNLLIVAGRFQL